MKRRDIITGLFAALIIGAFFSPYASSFPDGLEKSAEIMGVEESENPSFSAPLSGYAVSGIKSPGASSGLSGIIGTLFTFIICTGLAFLIRAVKTRRKK